MSFYNSLEDAESLSNPLPLDYTNSISPEPVYVRIENSEGCYQITSFIINVFDLPGTNQGQTLTICFGGSTDELWDLTDVELDILDGRQYNIGFEYYETIQALEAGVNQIPDPENYLGNNSVETLFLKVINRTTGCYKAVPFDLDVQNGPEFNNINSFQICENQSATLDLSEVELALILPEVDTPLFEFYRNLQNANQQINPIVDTYNYSSNADVIYLRATNAQTGCFTVSPITIDVIATPIANPAPDLSACDDDLDGIVAFNFIEQANIIRGNLPEEDYTVTFYGSQDDALNLNNELPTTYFGSDQQTIFARLQQTATGCFAINSFTLNVFRLPFVDIPTQYLCINNPELMVSADTGFSADTYLWSNGMSSAMISISEIGSYWVDITSEFGCSNRITFEVLESETAQITSIEVTSFSDPASITVNVSGNGNYTYQLDNGPEQSSNVFSDVTLGYRLVSVTDLNGCATTSETVLVLGAPKFFSPNGDAENDLWMIPGLDQFPGSEIFIYDRTGKLLTILDAQSSGWDGTFNGAPLPATDYWFSLKLNNGPQIQTINGHFALRR